MGLVDRIRGWIWKAEEAANELEYAALEAVHEAEHFADEHTGGRVSEALERIDEESEELLERLHLEDGEDAPSGGNASER
jgi:hypothetical protein